MIDKQGRLFGKINVFDLLVIVVLAVIVGRIIYDKMNVQQIVTPPQDTILIELQADLLNPIGQTVAEGQKVYDKRTGVYLGQVREVSIRPVPVAVAATNGDVIWVDSQRSSEVRLVLVNQGTITENAYQVGALAIRIGERITLVGPQFSFDASIIGLGKE
ncbi:MAG: DUF4330 domain-containing protein [Firmicutes bacterium]|nr:DUF4330 domain-containing protein [Bacillota bacterium]